DRRRHRTSPPPLTRAQPAVQPDAPAPRRRPPERPAPPPVATALAGRAQARPRRPRAVQPRAVLRPPAAGTPHRNDRSVPQRLRLMATPRRVTARLFGYRIVQPCNLLSPPMPSRVSGW